MEVVSKLQGREISEMAEIIYANTTKLFTF